MTSNERAHDHEQVRMQRHRQDASSIPAASERRVLAGAQRLEGTIDNLKRSRKRREFVLSQIGGDTGLTAMSAAASGLGGLAAGAASVEASEAADYVEFDLDGKPVRGWFWRFPFVQGDWIEVVVEASTQGWLAYGARRQADGCVAVYPHCYQGVKSHYRSSARFWVWAFLAVFIVSMLLMAIPLMFDDNPVQWAPLATGVLGYGLPASLLVFGFLAYRATRKTIGFARMAEQIFEGFGWPDPANINLRRTSHAKRRKGDSNEYGNFFFRY